MFAASWKVPSLLAPSPKKQQVTRSVPRYLLEKAAPTAIGGPPPTIQVQVGDVHRAALAPAVARRLAEELGVHVAEVAALGDEVAVAAVGAGDLVLGGEVRHHTRRHRLLADVEVEGAGDLARLHQLARLLLEDADAHHAPVQIEQRLARRFHTVILRSV
jgi:hypothetical protein